MIEPRTNIPEMLGIKEVAEKFGISQYYARQLALSGAVKAVRIGRGKILVNTQSVVDYFNSAYISTPAPAQNGGIKPIAIK